MKSKLERVHAISASDVKVSILVDGKSVSLPQSISSADQLSAQIDWSSTPAPILSDQIAALPIMASGPTNRESRYDGWKHDAFPDAVNDAVADVYRREDMTGAQKLAAIQALQRMIPTDSPPVDPDELWPRRFSDKDAKMGADINKLGQSVFFARFKK